MCECTRPARFLCDVLMGWDAGVGFVCCPDIYLVGGVRGEDGGVVMEGGGMMERVVWWWRGWRDDGEDGGMMERMPPRDDGEDGGMMERMEG